MVSFPLIHNEGTTDNSAAMSDAIFLLDKYATMFAEKDNPPPHSFHESFAQFVKVFKEHNYPVAYLSDGGVVAHYHRQFLESCSF